METLFKEPEVKERKTIDRGQFNQPVFGCFFYGCEASEVEREKNHRLIIGDQTIPVRVIDCAKLPLDRIPEICETTWNIYDCSNKDFIDAVINNQLDIIKTHTVNIGQITGLNTPAKAQAFVKPIQFTYVVSDIDISLIIFEKLKS